MEILLDLSKNFSKAFGPSRIAPGRLFLVVKILNFKNDNTTHSKQTGHTFHIHDNEARQTGPRSLQVARFPHIPLSRVLHNLISSPIHLKLISHQGQSYAEKSCQRSTSSPSLEITRTTVCPTQMHDACFIQTMTTQTSNAKTKASYYQEVISLISIPQ